MRSRTDDQDEDIVRFIAEEDEAPPSAISPIYKILIVDDEEEVHKITRLTLRDLIIDAHEMHFLSAYSLAEAKAVFGDHSDIAVIIIDVVMETNSAGLELVKFIRNDLSNRTTRIILRTGQPGVAPEDKVILDYDINDYKSKTELTSQKLLTSIIACIRGYRDIVLIDRNRNGLKQIISSTATINEFQDKTLQAFYGDMLDQLIIFHQMNGDRKPVAGFVIVQDDDVSQVIAASGRYTSYLNQSTHALVDREVREALGAVTQDRPEELIFGEGHYIICHRGFENTHCIIRMQCETAIEQDMIRIFIANITQAVDNYTLNRNIQITEREIISTLSEIVEKRDMSTAHHIKRVSEYAGTLGPKIGLAHEDCKRVKIACMMHDVGKIGISDQILLKPDILSPEEYEIIKEHARIGYRILQNSSLPIMKAAAEIALNHHERWDGTGYPNQLQGLQIPLNARLITLLDVFDALTHKRVYKEAWDFDEALQFIQDQSGKMFDPLLVEEFFSSLGDITEIWRAYPDEPE